MSLTYWHEWIKKYRVNSNDFTFESIYDYLRDGCDFRITRGTRALQLLELPSFDPVVSYEIINESHFNLETSKLNTQYRLLKTVWVMDKDLKRLGKEGKSNFTPTIEYAHAALPVETVNNLFKDFQQHIPIWFYLTVEEDYMGCDGASYELALGNPFLGVRYHWWSDKPDEWMPIYKAFDKAKTLFENLLIQANGR